MKTFAQFLILCWISTSIVVCAADKSDKGPKNRGDDEAAIRAAIDAYVDAYNRGDAETLASLWSDTGEWIAPDGERLTGRKEIEAAMKAAFAAQPRNRLEVSDTRVRLLTSDAALEEGTARVIRNGEEPEESTYQAVHVKRQGKWQLESVREVETPVADVSQNLLGELAWLVGEWVDDSDGSAIQMKVEWTMNHKFLVVHFDAEVPDMPPLVGAQVIGYDASTGTIRSWLFDADGTIGEGTWTNDGKQWIVKSSQVLSDGRHASSTNVYTPRDADSYGWKSFARKVGDDYLPNIDEVVVQRKTSAVAFDDADVDPTSDDAPRRN